MILKLAGAGILVSSAAYCAARMISTEKNKIDRLSAYVEIVSYVKNQIDLYSMPIEKILKGINSSVLESIGITHAPSRFDDIIVSDESVSEQTQKTLRDFSFSLGKSYREMQIKLCDKAITELEKQKKELTDAFPSRKKTIVVLCFSACGMAIIALI